MSKSEYNNIKDVLLSLKLTNLINIKDVLLSLKLTNLIEEMVTQWAILDVIWSVNKRLWSTQEIDKCIKSVAWFALGIMMVLITLCLETAKCKNTDGFLPFCGGRGILKVWRVILWTWGRIRTYIIQTYVFLYFSIYFVEFLYIELPITQILLTMALFLIQFWGHWPCLINHLSKSRPIWPLDHFSSFA